MEKNIEHYSQEMQDLAALILMGEYSKSNPNTFLDIGCRESHYRNNTMLLEKNGWKGICVDIEDFSEDFKDKRNSPFYQVDTTSKEFINILNDHFPTKFIHYISLDVDVASLETLKNLLKNGFKFAFMTFEHDLHWVTSHTRRRIYDPEVKWNCEGRTIDQVENCKFKSKDMLGKGGFTLLFENVSFYEKSTGKWLHPWEDWWINPTFFSPHQLLFLETLVSKNIHFEDCVDRIYLSSQI